MANSQKLNEDDYSKFDFMTTEELQQILRDDFEKADESDIDMVLYVSGLLAARRKPGELEKTAFESWESFEKNYHPELDQAADDEPPEEVPHKKHKGSMPWWTRAVAAAAMFAVIMGSALTAKAFGFDIWDIIVKWTQETFHIGYYGDQEESRDPNENNNHVISELQSSLNLYGVEVALVPSWFPEGFEEMSVEVKDTPKQRQFAAFYQNGTDEVKIRIADYLEGNPAEIEKSDELLEVYTSDGIDYYIFANYDLLRAVWINGKYECFIMCTLSQEDLKTMIDSIGKE